MLKNVLEGQKKTIESSKTAKNHDEQNNILKNHDQIKDIGQKTKTTKESLKMQEITPKKQNKVLQELKIRC